MNRVNKSQFCELRAHLRPFNRPTQRRLIKLWKAARQDKAAALFSLFDLGEKNFHFNQPRRNEENLFRILGRGMNQITSLQRPFPKGLFERKIFAEFNNYKSEFKNLKFLNELPPVILPHEKKGPDGPETDLVARARDWCCLQRAKNHLQLMMAASDGVVGAADPEGLLANRQVIFIGESHAEGSHASALVALMPRLRAHGVTHLALEGLDNDSETREAFERFFETKDPEALAKIKENWAKGELWGEAATQNTFRTFEVANANGLRIVPLEDKEDLGLATLHLLTKNFTALYKVRDATNDKWADVLDGVLAGGGKVAVYGGAKHFGYQADANPLNLILEKRLGRPLGPVVHFRTVERTLSDHLANFDADIAQSPDPDAKADVVWWVGSGRGPGRTEIQSIYRQRPSQNG